LEKWASGVLGAVCVLLLVNLVWHNVVRAGSPTPAPVVRRAPEERKVLAPPAHVKDDLSKYDAQLETDQLKAIQARPKPDIPRSPFEYPAPPKPAAGPGSDKPAGPPAPPPPPPIPFTMIGYSEKAGGMKEALLESKDDIFVVHEGETFANKYQVTKITPSTVEIVDQETRQTAQMPLVAPPSQ
jgi:hypothetical protein